MPVPADNVSRYGLTRTDLRQAALALQVGQGVADRLNSAAADAFLALAEDWAEQQVSDVVGVPLKPFPYPGQTADQLSQVGPSRRNFPLDFIQAVLYRAVGLLLQSEYSENAPNVSEYGSWALGLAEGHIGAFRSRRTNLVGAGRQRNPNPFVPPNIGPVPPRDPSPGGPGPGRPF